MSDSSAFNFTSLSPDTLWYALEGIGIRAESGFLPLNSYENRVYQFVDEDKKRWVVKFYRPLRWSDEQILEEHQFSLELMAADIPVVAPSVINGHTLHHYQRHRFALFPSAGGRGFEVDNLDQMAQVGQFLGRIHQVGKAKTFQHRTHINLGEFLYQPRALLENSSFIPSYLENSFFQDLDTLIKQIEQHWVEPEQQVRLHGDCHPSNILWADQASFTSEGFTGAGFTGTRFTGPMFVDMDDAKNGPAIQDIWMLLSGDRHEKIIQLDLILEAYGEFCDFDSKQLKLIEPLRGLRMVHYMAWLAKRWQDPAFPIAFPWFKEAKYWENQVLGFKEQISALQESPLSLTPQW